MTKNVLLTGLLAVAISASAHADLLRVSAFGGYTTVSLKSMNDNLDKRNKTGNPEKDVRLSGGYIAGLEVASGLLIPIPFTEVVLRGEAIGLNQAQYKTAASEYKTDAMLTNALLGLSVGLTPPLSPLGFSVGAYGGYGYAVAKTSGIANNNQYTGSSFVGELEAKLKYKLMPMVSLDLFGGMRFENVASFTDGVSTLKDISGTSTDDQAFDFSGFDGGLGLSVGF